VSYCDWLTAYQQLKHGQRHEKRGYLINDKRLEYNRTLKSCSWLTAYRLPIKSVRRLKFVNLRRGVAHKVHTTAFVKLQRPHQQFESPNRLGFFPRKLL